jgi:hypothetical protein
MKLGIMQPYFFPYLGYFNLLCNVDLFVVYDTVQYIRRGWIHRNRVLHQNKTDWQYIIVPVVKAPQKTPIVDVKISSEPAWMQRLLGQLSHYENEAPYAEKTIDFVKGCLSLDEVSLSRFNVSILKQCAKLLGINFRYVFCSETKIELDPMRSGEERILDLCEYLGAKEYLNLPGGVNLYSAENFRERDIKLTFLNLPTFTYQTGKYTFEPNLSIVDLLMWNAPEDIKKFLNRHRDTGKNNNG